MGPENRHERVMKNLLLIVLSCCALALAACGRTGEKKVTLGFSQIGAESEWRTANSQSIKDEAEKQGIVLKFSDAQQKQEKKQEAQLFSYIAGEHQEKSGQKESRFRIHTGAIVFALVLAAGAIAAAGGQ